MVQRFLDHFHEPISGFTHLGGAILSAIGMIWLIVLTHHSPTHLISVIVYGISKILTYSASTALHLPKVSDRVRQFLVRLDHASIYIMIAGTYTPFIVNSLDQEVWRWSSLWIIWLLAVAGVIYKLWLFHENRWSTLSYIAMGWLAVALLPQFINSMSPATLILIVAGGVTYSLGAIIFAMQKPNFHKYFGFHEIWHLFVLGGSAFHFVAVFLVVGFAF